MTFVQFLCTLNTWQTIELVILTIVIADVFLLFIFNPITSKLDSIEKAIRDLSTKIEGDRR